MMKKSLIWLLSIYLYIFNSLRKKNEFNDQGLHFVSRYYQHSKYKLKPPYEGCAGEINCKPHLREVWTCCFQTIFIACDLDILRSSIMMISANLFVNKFLVQLIEKFVNAFSTYQSEQEQ